MIGPSSSQCSEEVTRKPRKKKRYTTVTDRTPIAESSQTEPVCPNAEGDRKEQPNKPKQDVEAEVENGPKSREDFSKTEKKRKKKRNRDRETSMNRKATKVFQSLLTVNAKRIEAAQEEIRKDIPVEETTTEIKKMPKRKKKKLVQRAESHTETESRPDTKQLAISYLRSWKRDKANWHFQKSRQLWLIRNIYIDNAIDNDDFPSLLEYLEGCKGGVRTRLLHGAQVIQDSVNAEDQADADFDAVKVSRARDILQTLSE